MNPPEKLSPAALASNIFEGCIKSTSNSSTLSSVAKNVESFPLFLLIKLNKFNYLL
jgi:hypothetical protein